MPKYPKSGKYFLTRPLIVAGTAAALGLLFAALAAGHSFRNQLCDAFFIEAFVLALTAWLSYLKARKLAFFTFHPFRHGGHPESWRDRVPKLGAPSAAICL